MREGDKNWLADKAQWGWEMPCAPRWKRAWGVRHVRAAYHAFRLGSHEEFVVRCLGMVPSGYDRWVLYGMWRGFERTEI